MYLNLTDRPLSWVLLFALAYSSDDIIDCLSQAYRKLAWDRREPAKKVLIALARQDSLVALTKVAEITEGRYPEQHRKHARGVLVRAAQKRKISLGELAEQTLSGGDMRIQGEVLSLGSRHVTLRLTVNLELQACPEQGKPSKSAPRIRKDDDPALHAAAKERINAIKKDLKRLGPRLQQRLQAMYLCGRQWTSADWQQWLNQQPLLAVTGQRIVWARLNAEDNLLSTFRIAEDLSLIDADDKTIEPAADETITLWHQLLGDAGSTETWREHFADYEIEPLLSQFNEIATDVSDLDQPPDVKGKQVAIKTFNAWIKQNGYYMEQGMGEGLGQHYLLLPYLNQAIVLYHDEFIPFYYSYSYDDGEDDEGIGLEQVRAICVDLGVMARGEGTSGELIDWDSLPVITRAIVSWQMKQLHQRTQG